MPKMECSSTSGHAISDRRFSGTRLKPTRTVPSSRERGFIAGNAVLVGRLGKVPDGPFFPIKGSSLKIGSGMASISIRWPDLLEQVLFDKRLGYPPHADNAVYGGDTARPRSITPGSLANRRTTASSEQRSTAATSLTVSSSLIRPRPPHKGV